MKEWKTEDDFADELALCSCVEIWPVLKVVFNFLTWAGTDGIKWGFEELYGDEGLYYIVATWLESHGLIEHGISIRHPMLTEKGRRFRQAILDFVRQSSDEREDS